MAKVPTNGTLKIILSVLGLGIVLGGMIWSLAIQSGNLARACTDVTEVKSKQEVTDKRVNKVEDAVILIQADTGYIKKEIKKISDKIDNNGK